MRESEPLIVCTKRVGIDVALSAHACSPSSSAVASSLADVIRGVLVFFLFYLLAFAVGAVIVNALGADILVAITASIACLGNIGPGFGPVEPMGNFADLHPVSKVVLTAAMWIDVSKCSGCWR